MEQRRDRPRSVLGTELHAQPKDPAKAVDVNAQFQRNVDFWSALIAEGALGEAESFITPIPHMTFVRGEHNVRYLRERHETLRALPPFERMEFSTDPKDP